MLGMAYVAPIGMQNIYVINSAIANRKTRAYAVALITTFLDISLALACFFGIGAIMERFQSLKLAILLVGSLAVIYIGIKLIRSTPETKSEVNVNKPLTQVIMTCLLVTWANPQALIDGTLLLGGFKATLSLEASRLFILGVCLASAFWFIGITTIVSTFKNNFNSKVIKMINIICGIILVYYGLRLGFKFIEIIL
jgi:L-lysine exporter family protein LysE/ArgO